MMNSHPQTVRTLVMAAGLAAAHTTVAVAVGEPVQDAAHAAAAASSVKKTLDQATDLLAVSKVVKAKELLGALRADAVAFTAADSARYQELVRAVAARERTLDRNDLSLQKAEAALDSGELPLAEQHARSVASSSGVSPLVQKQAEALLTKIQAKRQDAARTAPAAIRAAANAFDMGRYADAKALIETVARSGADLAPAEAAILDDYRGRVLELAKTDASLFSRPAAGMIQPGEIQPRNPEQPAEPEKLAAAQPEAAPAAQPEKPADDAIAAARRNEAARELARANKLFEDKKYADALSVYQNIRATYGDVLSPDQTSQLNANVSAGQQAMTAAATAVPAAQPGGALSTFQKDKSIAKQQTLAEFNNYIIESKKALDQSSIDQARQLAAKAELRISEKKALFGEPEFADLMNRVSLLQADISKAADTLSSRNAADITKKLEDDARRRQEGEQAAKAQKIREHIDRVRQLQSERKYDEALQVCEQILFIDPLNPSGLLLRDVLTDMRMFREMNLIDLEKGRSYNELALDNTRALLAPTQIVAYPKDWPNISNLRSEAVAFQDTVDNRRVIASLEGTRIPKAELADTPFEAALKYLQTFANVNMDIDWPSLEAIGVQKDATVSMSLTNPTVQNVLDTVLSKVSPSADSADLNRAGWTVYDGVLHIGSEPALRKNKVMVIYDVQDLLFEVRDKVDVPELDLQASFQNSGGRGGGGGGGQSPFGGSGGRGQQQRQPGQGLQRPFEERLRDLRNIIVAQVDPNGWQDNSGDTGTIQVFQQNLIITNTPKNHRAIEGLLSQLRRVRNMQINVEARFLVVSSDFFEKIGFDIDVYLNAHGNQVRFLRNNGNYAFMPSEFFPDGRYSGNNVGSTNKVVDSDLDGIPDAPLAGNGPASTIPENFSVVGITNGTLGLTSRLMTSPFASEVTGSGTAAPALGISGTFLDDVQVDFLLEATQADRRAVSLNAPKLTFTNGQTANVFVARQIAYISDLTPTVADNSVAWDPQTAFVNDGVTLLVSGVILADRRYVQLDVETRVSNYPEDKIRRIPVSAAAGGTGGVGGGGAAATASAFIELPQGQIQSVSTTVTVPDQGTVLLGGQRLTSEIEVESGVPVLSKIPIINRFFSNRSMSREERTLLMLIRPQILIQDESEDKFFPGLREAIRTGGFGN